MTGVRKGEEKIGHKIIQERTAVHGLNLVKVQIDRVKKLSDPQIR